MVEPAEAWLTSKGLMVKREFPTPWGICDLVGCSFNKRNVRKRLRLGQKKPVGSHLRVMLLSDIPEENDRPQITPSQLAETYSDFFDTERIVSELNRLEKDKFVQKTASGSVYKLNGWMPLQKKIVALELKLSRVQDVLHQAISNLEFADESYVGLPMKTASRLARSNTVSPFIEHGIGILGLNRENYKVFRSPTCRKKRTDPVFQSYCVERFWRHYSKGSST
ncbi:hypothetical protein ACFL5Z_17825 [Planctomycetota bacterium]